MAPSRLFGSVALVALTLATLGACSRSPTPPAEHASAPAAAGVNVEWIKFVDDFIESYFVA